MRKFYNKARAFNSYLEFPEQDNCFVEDLEGMPLWVKNTWGRLSKDSYCTEWTYIMVKLLLLNLPEYIRDVDNPFGPKTSEELRKAIQKDSENWYKKEDLMRRYAADPSRLKVVSKVLKSTKLKSIEKILRKALALETVCLLDILDTELSKVKDTSAES